PAFAHGTRLPLLVREHAQRAPPHPVAVDGIAAGEGFGRGHALAPIARARGGRTQADAAACSRSGRAHSIRAASSNDSRGERGKSCAGSPWPMLTMMLERTAVPPKKAASTMALSNPVIGPQSRPSARAA